MTLDHLSKRYPETNVDLYATEPCKKREEVEIYDTGSCQLPI